MFENLSEEVLENIKRAQSREEAFEILKKNGISLSDDDLSDVGGGTGCIFDGEPTRVPCDHDCIHDINCNTNQSCSNFCPLYTTPDCPFIMFK